MPVNSIVETYDHLERQMRSRLPVPEVQAFQTTTFDRIGFPGRIERIEDVIRYVDWCCHPGANAFFVPDARLEAMCAHLIFSETERDLMRTLSKSTAAFTRRLGRETHPILVHTAQIGPFRILCELQRRLGGGPLSILEVGGGSGYLSALLAMAGNTVITSDNSQGLHLFQHCLFEECFGDRYGNWLHGHADALSKQIQLLPWWDYLDLRRNHDMTVDVAISNNNLGEMNPNALAYTVRVAKQLMQRSKVKLFVFTSPGTPMHQDINGIHAAFLRAGFKAVISEPFRAYVPAEHDVPQCLLNFEIDAPVYRPSAKTFTMREILMVTPETLPVEMDFVSFLDIFEYPPADIAPVSVVAATTSAVPRSGLARRIARRLGSYL